MHKKDYICSAAAFSFENGKYLVCIIDDSVIAYGEILDGTRTVPTNFNETNAICKTKRFCILLAITLIDIAILIAVSIYCNLIK